MMVIPEKITVSPLVRNVTASASSTRAALGQLLLEPGDDEQRVADADPEAEHRRGVLDEQRQLGLARDDRQDGEAGQDRRDADRQRHQRRDQAAIERYQHQQDQRQGEHLGVREAGLAQGVDLAPEGGGPDQRDVEALRRVLRRQVLLEVRQELSRHAVVDPETQDLDRGRPVLADELLLHVAGRRRIPEPARDLELGGGGHLVDDPARALLEPRLVARVPLVVDDHGDVAFAASDEPVPQRDVDRVALRAGDVPAAPGQQRRQWRAHDTGDRQEHEPQPDDRPAKPAERGHETTGH